MKRIRFSFTNDSPKKGDVVFSHSNFVQAMQQEVCLDNDKVPPQLLLILQHLPVTRRYASTLEHHHVKWSSHTQHVLPTDTSPVIPRYHLMKQHAGLFIGGFQFLRMFSQVLQKFVIVRQVTKIYVPEDTLHPFEIGFRSSFRVIHFELCLFLFYA